MDIYNLVSFSGIFILLAFAWLLSADRKNMQGPRQEPGLKMKEKLWTRRKLKEKQELKSKESAHAI